jgi:vacuolar-type H+-ATPase subunit E/Vma4
MKQERFLIEYEKLKDKLKQITTDEELDNFSKDLSNDDQHSINENL